MFPAGGVVGFVGAVVVPPLIVNFCPTKIVSVVKLFHAFKFATDTPFLFAIAHSESPLTTVYVPVVEPVLPLLLPVFPVGGVVGGVTVPPLMVNFCPTKIISLDKLFHAFKFATDTPFLLAIPHNESPDFTV